MKRRSTTLELYVLYALASTALGSLSPSAGEERHALAPDVLEWHGRVVLPPDTPSDESLDVVLLGEERERDPRAPFGDRSWDRRRVLAREPVGADGRLHLSVRASELADLAGEPLAVDLDGRYLYLDEPVALDPSGAGGELALEPELGGAIRGRLALPAGPKAPAGPTSAGRACTSRARVCRASSR